MSRSAPSIATTLPVAPGTSVVNPMYTSVGFDAGDYVYQYGANLVGWPKGSTMGLGVENTLIAGTTYTGYAQTGINSRTASYGPFTDTIVYSGTTKTAGQIVVSPTTLSGTTYATGSCKCVTLTDGRLAYAYRTGATTLVSAIYSSAGVLQGTTTTLCTTVGFGLATFSMAAMSDGGFLVAFYDSTNNWAAYCRLNSSNTMTVNNAVVFSGGVASFQVAATQNYYGFSYHTTPGAGSAFFKTYSLANSNTGTYSASLSAVYATGCAGTNSDTFVLAAANQSDTTTYFYHLNGSASQFGSVSTYGSAYGSSSFIAGCGSTANSTYAGAYAANFAFLNAAGSLIIARVYASSATTLTVQSAGTGIGYSNFALGSTTNGGCVLLYRGASSVLAYATYNAACSQIATGTLAAGSIIDTNLGVCGIAGGTFAVGYAPPATGYATLATAYTATYTNGVTTLTGTTTYTPANGYYVLGVALTTAAAGSTGMVAVNGSANLGASYPTVTSNILFDSTGTAFTARSAINANRGNVIGTNVTLRGLE